MKAALGLDGKSLAQAAIRFGLMKSEVSTVLVGFSNTAHIDEAVACSGAGIVPGYDDEDETALGYRFRGKRAIKEGFDPEPSLFQHERSGR